MPEHPRAQLIHIDVDRRLGHEWDEWDGRPLPNRGDYDSSPLLFFLWSALALFAAFGILAAALFLLGRRDWVENASVKVYNALALLRGRKVGKGEMLLLIPRCLSKETLDGVLGIAGKYRVPVFVATRGQLARRVIRERRPRAVVAVACERDMVSGLHDVAGKIPVLGLTMTLPSGPCKDASVDLGQLERWVQAYVL